MFEAWISKHFFNFRIWGKDFSHLFFFEGEGGGGGGVITPLLTKINVMSCKLKKKNQNLKKGGRKFKKKEKIDVWAS